MSRRALDVAGAAAAATLFVLLAWPGLRENSATYDETIYLPTGYAYLTRGEIRVGLDNPWLLKALFALPVMPLAPTVSPETDRAYEGATRVLDGQWIFADRFLYHDNRPQELVFRARLVTLALTAGLVVLVYAWARATSGTVGALFTASLLALDPNFLAHGTLATLDVGETFFIVAALFFARRTLRAFTVGDAVATAIACAAAFAVKHTATLLVPALGAFVLIGLLRREPWRVQGRAATLVLLWSITTAGSLWIVYGSGDPSVPSPGFSEPLAGQLRSIRAERVRTSLADQGIPLVDAETFRQLVDRAPDGWTERIIAACARWRLAPVRYLAGLAQEAKKAQGRRSFLLGTISSTGSWAYFPVAFAVKTPLATLAALLATFVVLWDPRSRLRRDGELAWLLAPAAIVTVATVGSRLNIGLRHLLPLYPFVYVLAGSLPGELRRLLGRRWAWLAGGLVLLVAAETIAARPYFISFFNAATRGGGLRILSDSNLDWGQGLPALRRWMDERGVARVNLCYFGSADPAAYGIEFVSLPGSHRVEIPGVGAAGYPAQQPELPGWVAIGATNLQGTYLDQRLRDAYAFLGRRDPAAVLAGGAMYVYWVERWGE
ncbi:MAG TPA: glycosyltransferase family 39 protein [Candidatus Binatia bacterium]|nr:glycosyltransferase family 39 protein [Candidatus Binatia bacterium]